MDTSCGCCFPQGTVFTAIEILAPKFEIAPTIQQVIIQTDTKPTVNQPYMPIETSQVKLTSNDMHAA